MKAVAIALLVVLALVVAFVAWVVGLYNGLVVLRNRFKNAFAQIDAVFTSHRVSEAVIETA